MSHGVVFSRCAECVVSASHTGVCGVLDHMFMVHPVGSSSLNDYKKLASGTEQFTALIVRTDDAALRPPTELVAQLQSLDRTILLISGRPHATSAVLKLWQISSFDVEAVAFSALTTRDTPNEPVTQTEVAAVFLALVFAVIVLVFIAVSLLPAAPVLR